MPDLRIATLNGGDGTLTSTWVDRFRAKLRGELLRPDENGYEAARKVWNGMVDKRPALIARCTGTADVVASVNFARDNDILLSVRGGGHNYAGKAVCDGGLMIDLSPMSAVKVDPSKQIARAQAGMRLGEFDRKTQKFGLATTLGVNTDTGIAGLTLGGGYGWLAGKYGLACDNLVSAEVVTADGQIVEANAEQHADLFWALRGAGANFGVVTWFEYRLHAVGPVLGGMVVYPLDENIVRFFDEFSRAAPDELCTAGVVVTAPDGSPAFAIVACYCGRPDEGESIMRPLKTFSTPLMDLISPRSYVEMQSTLDDAWPPGRHYYNKAHNIRSLNEESIRTVLRYAGVLPTPVSNIAFQQLHGAASRVPVGDTAFPHRYDHYDLLVHPATDNPNDSEKIIRWARECWGALQPFVEQAVYVNALEDAVEEGERRVRQAYGPNYDRLVMLKSKYDPGNLFRLNSNIRPEVVAA
ncbi:MAG: FAD-binding oxidoreductase [Armatimonadota bacterium]